MKRPADKQPFFIDADGNESPLILAPSLVDEARKLHPNLWIEPNLPIKRVGWSFSSFIERCLTEAHHSGQ